MGGLLYKEHILKISSQSGQALQSNPLKHIWLSACALVSVTARTGGLFDVYDVTSNTYNVLPPLVVHLDYRWREILTLGACSMEASGCRDNLITQSSES